MKEEIVQFCPISDVGEADLPFSSFLAGTAIVDIQDRQLFDKCPRLLVCNQYELKCKWPRPH